MKIFSKKISYRKWSSINIKYIEIDGQRLINILIGILYVLLIKMNYFFTYTIVDKYKTEYPQINICNRIFQYNIIGIY